MASLYISEYAAIQPTTGDYAQAAHEPALATQKVTVTGVSAQSAAFNAQTKFVRLHTDAICSVSFGSSPTATTSHLRMPTDSTEYFGVNPTDKVAAITNT